MLVDQAGGEFLPRGDDFADGPPMDRLDQDVNVVWHDNPSEKPVTLRVEIQKRGLDDSSGYRITEGAASVAGIDPSFEAFAALSVQLGIRKKDDLAVKALDGVLRNAVGEMIGNVLKGPGRIKVWQVASAVPSGIAHLRRRRFPGIAAHQSGCVVPGIAIHQNGKVSRFDLAPGPRGEEAPVV